MKSLKGTKTADNLAKAFAGESQARNRYTFYGNAAGKENHKAVEAVFLETADNETAHAKIFYNYLVQGLGPDHINVNASYPIGLGNTVQNLEYAAAGEKEEWGSLYPGFADIARDEGFPEIEASFRNIIEIEKAHEKRYLDLLNRMKNGSLYKMETENYWKCRNCGFIYFGTETPLVCPACKHPQGYFEIMYNTP